MYLIMSSLDGTIHILHVDDEPGFAEMVATFLERKDSRFEIETATDVVEGRNRLDSRDFDCIVSDYDMSAHTGIDFLEAVRNEYPELPFILYTGRGSEEVASDAISAGVTDYLEKKNGSSQYTVLANRINNAVESYHTQAELTDREQRLNLFFEQSPLGVIEWNQDFMISRMNDAAEEILGYNESDILDCSWEAIVPESEQEPISQVIDKLMTASGGYHSINKNVRKDEKEIICEWHNRVITDNEDNVVAIFSQFQDITDRKKREQQLNALHDVATVLTEGRSVTEICEQTIQASEEILAFDRSAIDIEKGGLLVKTAASDGIPEENVVDMPVDEGIAGKTYTSGNSYLITDLDTHELGNPHGPYSSVISVPIGDHGVFQAAAETSDVFNETDLELAELLIRHTENALNRLNREQRLERQKDQLTEFNSTVSHDLRNPLNVAEGNLTLAREKHDSPHLDRVADALERMDTLINDLLTLAEEGEQIDAVEPVRISDLVETCWQNVATDDAMIVIEADQSIQADETRLQQLVENLLRNAVIHGGNGVTITVGILDNASGFYIEDDGSGIPDDEREHIFEFGYSTNNENTGFGLTIVQKIVAAHGWDIRTTEAQEGGARFEITGCEFQSTTPR